MKNQIVGTLFLFIFCSMSSRADEVQNLFLNYPSFGSVIGLPNPYWVSTDATHIRCDFVEKNGALKHSFLIPIPTDLTRLNRLVDSLRPVTKAFCLAEIENHKIAARQAWIKKLTIDNDGPENFHNWGTLYRYYQPEELDQTEVLARGLFWMLELDYFYSAMLSEVDGKIASIFVLRQGPGANQPSTDEIIPILDEETGEPLPIKEGMIFPRKLNLELFDETIWNLRFRR